MKEIYVFCEGQTEQAFCSQVLQPHLFPNHDGTIHPIRIAHSRSRGIITRGGVNRYQIIKDDMLRTFRSHQRPQVIFTSMIDLYALPGDFPGMNEHTRNPDNPRSYVEALETALANDIGERRFIPHLQLHEFETLFFAELDNLRLFYDEIDSEIAALQAVIADHGDVEKINDTPTGAPSKRIIQLIPQYEDEKTIVGPELAACIGMEKMMEACSHFGDWIRNLEGRLRGFDE